MRQRRAGVIFFQRILPQLAPVLGELLIRRLSLIIADQLIKHPPHAGHMARQLRTQRLPVVSMHPPRQPGAVQFILRQSLGLLIVDALQQIFQPAQEQIGRAQQRRVAFRQQMQLINRRQRRQQRPLLQRRFATAADQLKDLNDKFNFTDPAGAELDVVFQPATPHFTSDHPFHVTQRLDHAEVDIAAEDEGAKHRAQLAGVGVVVIAHDPRFHHRVAFPVPALLLVIILQRRKAEHQRPAVAKRSQAHVHPIDKAVLRRLVERLDQPLPQAGKELGVIQLAAAAAGGAMLRPGKDQIDIGREVQLAAAQLSHPEDQQRLRLTLGVAGRSPLLTAGGIQPVASGDNQGLCQDTQLLQRLFFAYQRQRLRPGNADHHLAAEKTQLSHQPRFVSHRLQAILQPGLVMPPLFRLRRGVRKLVQPAWLGDHTLFDKITERHHRPGLRAQFGDGKIRWQAVSDRLPVLL